MRPHLVCLTEMKSYLAGCSDMGILGRTGTNKNQESQQPMISLQSVKPHRSIIVLPKVDLPDFAVITGINGSGKSHLLEAIKQGAVKVDGITKPDPEIKLFNWTNLVPNNAGAADPIQLGRERDQFISNLHNNIAGAKQRFIDRLVKLKGTFLPLNDLKATLELNQNGFTELAKASEQAFAWAAFEQRKKHFLEETIASIVNSPVRKFLEHGATSRGIPIALFSEEAIHHSIPLNWTPVDIFQQNFSQIFAAYHRAWDENRYNTYANEYHCEKNIVVSEADFTTRFGPPPWEFVNRLLEEAHLDYVINRPEGRAERPFEAKLKNKTTQTEISFQDLSAGEKIIMSFALCLYNVNDRSRFIQYPKILLFDEIDAPLHPSMTKDLIRVIDQILTREKGVKVILTTHSPATVAFAPRDALFRLEKNPHRLLPCTREQAIQTLTSGYISVTENTRFVITEAKQDRVFYTALTRKLTENGDLHRSPNLVFIQSTDKKDREGGGKAQVKNWSSKLPEAGLTQVFGLIDRDEANVASPKIKVLQRYSLENYLLDPINVYAVLMHKGIHKKVFDCGIKDGNYYELKNLTEVHLQSISNAVSVMIERNRPELALIKGTFNVEYLCGKKLSLPIWIRDFRGHDLVTAFRATFQKEIEQTFVLTANDSEDLMGMLAERLPAFIPVDLCRTLIDLQSTPE
jgi:predicted ATPase